MLCLPADKDVKEARETLGKWFHAEKAPGRAAGLAAGSKKTHFKR
jgi:hypothetical protein